jgi:parvulin-like peptidyl-prolyl isomerase
MKQRFIFLTLGILVSATCASAVVVATVNGSNITSDEVNRVLMEGTQGRFDSLEPSKQNELRQRIIEGMVTQKLVYDDAVKTGVLDSREYKAEYQKLEERMKIQLATKKWEMEQFNTIKVDSKEVREYYDKNSDEFVDKEKVHARHILVKSSSDAEDIIKAFKGLSGDKLKSDFIALAKLKSTGPSAVKGGELGYVARDQMVKPFNDALFAMRIGTVSSEPVQTQFGYHVIYAEDKKPARKASFDEVKNFVENKLKMERFKVVMEKKMAVLKSKAKITYTK